MCQLGPRLELNMFSQIVMYNLRVIASKWCFSFTHFWGQKTFDNVFNAPELQYLWDLKVMEQIQMKHVLCDHTFLLIPCPPRDVKHSLKTSKLRQWIKTSCLFSWDVDLMPVEESHGDSVNWSLDISCKLSIFPKDEWVYSKGMKSRYLNSAKVLIFLGLPLVNDPLLK
jgi:hypothetical protein